MKYLDLAIANEQIKTVDIKGKAYSEVAQRIKAFRMVYPQGTIETEMLSNENGIVVFKANIYIPEYDEVAKGMGYKLCENKRLIATGTAYEKEDSSFINKTSYIENCETSAVGRALGMAGFGIDVSVASAEEVQNAINNQVITKEEAEEYTLTFGKYKGKTLKEIYEEDEQYIDWLLDNSTDERIHKIIELTLDIKIPEPEEQQKRLQLITEILELSQEKNIDIEEVHKKFKVNSLDKMTTEQMEKCIKAKNN